MVSGKQSSQNPEVDHLLAENERQREFISILQSTNQTNEQAIQTLRIAFTTAFECCPLSESGSNACTVIDEEAYYEPPFPTDSVKEEEGTWYKDKRCCTRFLSTLLSYLAFIDFILGSPVDLSPVPTVP
jgi:hypothetical protein